MRTLACLLLLGTSAFAQRQLTDDVRRFVSVDAPVIVLQNARVIDGLGRPPLDRQTLVIDRGRIVAMGTTAKIPAGAKVVDLSGKTVFPGLVGMHDHLFYPTIASELSVELAVSFPRLYLASGVTTIRTAGAIEPTTDIALARLIDAGRAAGPRIHPSGPFLDGAGADNPQMGMLRDAADARRTVAFWAESGATSFKAYKHITRDELAAVIDTAHQRKLKVTAHLCSIGWQDAAELGIDGLEHGPFTSLDSGFLAHANETCPNDSERARAALALPIDSPRIAKLIRTLVARKVAVTSTLAVYEAQVPNRPPLDQRVLDAMAPEYQADFLSLRVLFSDPNPAGPVLQYFKMTSSPWPKLFALEMAFERAFVKAGGLLVAGADPTGQGGVLAGYGDQREVELLVEAGFSPVEAIQIATSNGAQLLGDPDIGAIAIGKRADLVVVSGNPALDIRDIEKVDTVFKDGIGFDPKKLTESVRGAVGLR